MRKSRRMFASAIVVAAVWLLTPPVARCWGANGHRLVANKAIETLPPELRPFFEANRIFITQHAADPLDWLAKNPTERQNHVILFERYGRFPFGALPRNYQAALKKYGKTKLDANGLLPWQIGVYSEKLTNAFRKGNWEEARLMAAVLAYYVGEAYDPFKTTENGDGQLSGQPGVNLRFGNSLVDRFSQFLFLRPNDAYFISEPTDAAFEACLSSHSWLEIILLADLRARRGQPDYTDEYYAQFYNQAGAVLIRQFSDAATDIGAYWLTAWRNAGSPQIPQR